MRKLFLIVLYSFVLLTHLYALNLPINIVLHLDKSSQKYLESLEPWNYINVPSKANLSTLEYVIGIFRHGNKPPTDTYEGDPYPYDDERYWPNGYSQLTKIGKKQLYSIGKKLRNRYDGFLSSEYKNEEILVKSNAVDRVYNSAALLLAGLYPPKGLYPSKEYDEYCQTEWQPIPIWEQKHDMSKIAKDPSICPRFYKLEQEIEMKINEYTYQYQDIVDYLNNCTGLGIIHLRDLFRYWNLVYFQEQEGYKRPEWTENGVMEILTNIASSTFTALLASNQEMRKLIAGPLVKQFASEIRGKILMIGGKDARIRRQKFHLEGGHGTTLNGLLPALGFEEPFVPHLGSVFLMELHSSPLGNYIQTLYLTNEEEIQLLEIPGCGYECPVDEMLERMDKVTPMNWYAECQLSSSSNINKRIHFMFLIYVLIYLEECI